MSSDKNRHTVWLDDETWDMVKSHYHEDNCSTKNEFIDKAIRFYTGYLDTRDASAFLTEALSRVLTDTLGAFGKRMGHLMFKQAVECNMTNHMIAADTDIDLETLARLRARSVREVRETNGEIALRDDLIFQKSV